MSKKFKPCPKYVADLVVAMLKKYHEELALLKPKIDLLFAYNNNGPAVSHGGYPAYAVVKIHGLKERALGQGDAEIVIDGDAWEKLNDAQRAALIDHELEHLEIIFDQGTPKFDNCNRPMLGIKKHDHQFGWFDAIARRHGDNSIEVMQAKQLQTGEVGQLYFELQPAAAAAH